MLRALAPITVAARPTGINYGRHGFTLVELLVASTIGLIVMGSLATLLGLFSRTASSTQSVIDVTHRLRVVGDRLRKDLAGVTCKVSPSVAPESDSGYFEIIEGPTRDSLRHDPATDKAWVTSNPNGDFDDILLFTTRNPGEPFVGRYGLGTINASAAEVAWFLKASSTQPLTGLTVYDLYRKQLVVLGYVGVEPFLSGTNRVIVSGTLPFPVFYQDYDISIRSGETVPLPNPATVLYPNALGDLTKRENRFNRRVTWPFIEPFPFLFQGVNTPQATFDGTARAGEDVILRNVLSFDVRIFDPEVPVKTAEVGGAVLTPGDPTYVHNKNNITTARGAYVDLGWGSWDDIWPPDPPVPPATARPDEIVISVERPTWAPNIPAFSFDIAPGTTPRTVDPRFTTRFPGFLGEDQNRNGALDTGEDVLNNGTLDGPFTPFQLFGMHWVNAVQSGPNLLPVRKLDALPLNYDTWSTHYESNGINEDNDTEDLNGNGSLDPGEDINGNGVIDPLIDEGTDGRDNNGDGIPDDPAERETSPPYPVPLRGIEIRIRCIEPTTKEIRQITIRHAFDQS
jgi:prepilin-type N-terminal cleavage/methylation domain-containing protein